MVAGATGIDLFLLVIDAGEGRAAADARAPGDPAPARHRARRRRGHEGRRRRCGDARARGGRGARARARGRRRRGEREDGTGTGRAARRARRGGRRDGKGTVADAPLRRPRLHAARDRHRRHRHALVGTLGEGDELRAEPKGRSTSACAASRCTTSRSRAQRRDSAWPSRFPASSGTSCGAAMHSSLPARSRSATASTSSCTSSSRSRTARALNVHHGTSSTVARVVRAGERYAQLRLAAPVVAARGDRVVLRAHTTVGGGVVLDPNPPRLIDVKRLELLETDDPRCDRARDRARAGDGARPAGTRPAPPGGACARPRRGPFGR